MDNYSNHGKVGKRWIFERWYVVLNTMCDSVMYYDLWTKCKQNMNEIWMIYVNGLWMIYGCNMNKLWTNYERISIAPKSNPKTCQVFYIYRITRWINARCKAFLLDVIKRYHNTVLLWCIFMPVGGVVYILGQATGSQERHIWCSHTSTPILSSVPSSTKPWKINIFTIFYIAKNH